MTVNTTTMALWEWRHACCSTGTNNSTRRPLIEFSTVKRFEPSFF